MGGGGGAKFPVTPANTFGMCSNRDVVRLKCSWVLVIMHVRSLKVNKYQQYL